MKIGSCAANGFTVTATTESVAIPVLNEVVTVDHMRRSMWELASLKAQSWLISPFFPFGRGGAKTKTISRPTSKPFHFGRGGWLNDMVTPPLESSDFLKKRSVEPLVQHNQRKSSLGVPRSAVVRGAAAMFSTVATSGLSAAAVEPSAMDWAAQSNLARDYILYDTDQSQTLPSLAKALSDEAGKLAESRVIFTGEKHTSPVHHAFQLEVIKTVDSLDDNPTIIGLEMLWRQHQPALDAFVFGEPSVGGGSLAKLSERTQWDATWGFPIELYADLFNFAHQKKIRLCGLNVPYPVVQMVSQQGIGNLDPRLRNALPQVDLSNTEHRRRFMEAMGAMGKLKASEAENYYEAMALWDDYMASSIAQYITPTPKDGAGLKGATNTGKERMVVLVGANHVRGRVGIPDRFSRQTGLSDFVMVAEEAAWGTDTWDGDKLPDIGRPDLKAEADWVLFTKPQQRLKQPLKLDDVELDMGVRPGQAYTYTV